MIFDCKFKWPERLQSISFIILLFSLVSCYKETILDVIPEFSHSVENEDYEVPVTLIINNETSGANFYLWTFEGGTPETSDKKNPGEIRYYKAGKYKIRLEARNDFHQSAKEVEVEIDSAANIRFISEILINAFVPAEVEIRNLSVGADEYEWVFEGGNPSSSREQNPPVIRYENPGEYEIRLSAKAGRKTYAMTEKILLLPELETNFILTPSVESEEMEAPWRGFLQNKTINGILYRWHSDGGKILNDTACNTEILFDTPGDYTVYLEADNYKQKKQKSQTVRIKQNSNIYTFSDIKLGINTASYGCFFSSRLRKVFSQNEIGEKNGGKIDFTFFGLNSHFNYWTFLSPNEVQNSVFQPIKNAIHTKIILFPEKHNMPFSITDFDEMKNDSKLKSISFTPYFSREEYFTSNTNLPKLVFFETDDGRKGVIKIKEIIDDGLESYIVTDIKIQKMSSN